MIEITSDPIDRQKVLSELCRAGDGALVTFEGIVRDNARGKIVTHLFYETYRPMAIKEMVKISVEAARRWPVTSLVILHRVGHLEIGDTAVLVAVCSPHRAEAFEACRFTIDQLKTSVPIWKKEFYSDGAVWVEEKGAG